MCLKFGQIRSRAGAKAALKRLEKSTKTNNGMEDMYFGLDEFEFQPDSTSDYGVSSS